ncbi:MAG TPA: hypothetical protein VFY66_12945 [Anaerolineales bacterium]|nr:hypothetical protein [Anaerolineales bacterium]
MPVIFLKRREANCRYYNGSIVASVPIPGTHAGLPFCSPYLPVRARLIERRNEDLSMGRT